MKKTEKKSELSQLQVSVNEENKLDYLTEEKKLVDNPEMEKILKGSFLIVRDKENWFACLGKYKVTETKETKEEVEEELNTFNIEKILVYISIYMEMLEEVRTEKTNNL